MNQTLTPERLAGFFDHTLLKPYATKKDFENFCNNCKQYRFAMAAVNPSAVQFCKQYLNDTTVHVGAAIGFPLGQNTLETKRFETLDAIQNGADEMTSLLEAVYLRATECESIPVGYQDKHYLKMLIMILIYKYCYGDEEN